jgi:murein DD-endopeptidase MepM/ murein hydrolase activator NlpD
VPVSRRLTTTLCVLAIAVMAIAGQAATSKTSTSQTYVVKPGDTLSSIAARYGTTVSAIANANNIRNRNIVVIGKRLTIPGGGGSTSHRPGVLPAKLQAHPERVALRPLFVKWASHYGVSADLLQAIAWIESGWQTSVVSKTGAIGVGQLQPTTVDFLQTLIGMKLDPASANDNIRMSARFLRYLLDRTGNNVSVSVAAYYQGLRAVTTGPALPETWQYVANVLAVRPSFA